MRKPNDMSRCLAALEQDSTLVAVIEMGKSSWLVAGVVPGIERHPLKKLAVNEGALLALLYRWRDEAKKAGHPIKRICVAYEAGRDGFWLARWLRKRKIEAYVIHPTSVCVSRVDEVEKARLARLQKAPKKGPHAMVRLLASIYGLGIETADMLAHEVFSRDLRDRRAVPRYAGLTGSLDESGERRRE